MMKKTIIAAAVLSVVGSAGFACSVEESRNLSASISQSVKQAVAFDDAALGKVMALMQQAAVKEYHDGPFATMCARQLHIMDMVSELSDTLSSEKSAMLSQ